MLRRTVKADTPRTAPSRGTYRPHVMATNGMVTAGHPLAAWWGAEMLRRGGTAADAGVAAGLVINVVHNDMASLGGVAPIIYRSASSGSIDTIAGIGTWPAGTDTASLTKQFGEDFPAGIARVVVPAALDAWVEALRCHGTMMWEEIAEYPAQLARDGFAVHHFLAANLLMNEDGYRAWPENERIYLPGGVVPKPGDLLIQSDLARFFDRLEHASRTSAAEGGDRDATLEATRDVLYGGEVGRDLVEHYRAHGSQLDLRDMSAYRVSHEPAISTTFGATDIHATGPWSQGPVMPMALNICNALDLGRYEPSDPVYLHAIVEALRLAFSDLEAHCGDPRFVDVPIDALLLPSYGALRAELVHPTRTMNGIAPFGDPTRGIASAGSLQQRTPPTRASRSEPDTSFVCAIDSSGNMFSATPSDGYSGTPIVPGWGINACSRGRQSRVERDHPNGIAPGKRPRLTPNPIVATRHGKPYLALGTPGNNRQPQAMLQVFLLMELFGVAPQEAVERPRLATYAFPETAYPHLARPGLLRLERGAASAERDLRAMGHDVQIVPDFSWSMGGVCVIQRDPDTGVLWGGADPRRETYTVGW